MDGDATLDAVCSYRGPCAFCGYHDARHRVADAIVDRHGAGDSVEALAADYDMPIENVRRLVAEWKGASHD